jgi:hypothetical protein
VRAVEGRCVPAALSRVAAGLLDLPEGHTKAQSLIISPSSKRRTQLTILLLTDFICMTPSLRTIESNRFVIGVAWIEARHLGR